MASINTVNRHRVSCEFVGSRAVACRWGSPPRVRQHMASSPQGAIPLELLDIHSLRYVDCTDNRLSGPIPLLFQSRGERERLRQKLRGYTEDGLNHSWALRLVESLTSLWHFWLPVLDDATDLWLLFETSGGSNRGLWWTCLIVFLVADIERVYTAFFFIALSLRIVMYWIIPCCWGDFESESISMLAFGQDVHLDEPLWLLLDSLLWTLFGSRARSSPLMETFGMAGQSTGSNLNSTGLGLHGIDVVLFHHPFRYLGEFIMSFPPGHRREDIARPDTAQRRDISMVRAVGETLCVDPLFLALSVVTGNWDDNITGFVLLSALFSLLELVTELQFYVSQAEAAIPARSSVVAVEESESGYRNHGPRPIESSGPVRFEGGSGS